MLLARGAAAPEQDRYVPRPRAHALSLSLYSSGLVLQLTSSWEGRAWFPRMRIGVVSTPGFCAQLQPRTVDLGISLIGLGS